MQMRLEVIKCLVALLRRSRQMSGSSCTWARQHFDGAEETKARVEAAQSKLATDEHGRFWSVVMWARTRELRRACGRSAGSAGTPSRETTTTVEGRVVAVGKDRSPLQERGTSGL